MYVCNPYIQPPLRTNCEFVPARQRDMRRSSEAVHILVDCGYDALMSEDERKGLCRQLDCCVRCVCFGTWRFCTCGYGAGQLGLGDVQSRRLLTRLPNVFWLRMHARDGGDGGDKMMRSGAIREAHVHTEYCKLCHTVLLTWDESGLHQSMDGVSHLQTP